ncbi:MAG: hypothetical protein P3W90_002830 [Paracoccus sp. (in: a-proteobacteria)]|nr:hypothetical protein [Paracoccus sp. (in: a-proteobacteria)]
MIRAHLATFPPRRRILRRAVEAIVPQVDHLFVVLNGYEKVPGYLRKDDRITAIIPDRDVKDAGKFWFAPAPDDVVFLIDDDIAYPPDYVARTLAQLRAIGAEANVVGYYGIAFGLAGLIPWRAFLFPQALEEIRGVSLIGTGTFCGLGRNIPTLHEMEPFAGYVDHGISHWLQQRQILPWVLPRARKWLRNALPRNLRDTSLFQSVHRAALPEVLAKGRAFLTGWPHANHVFDASRPYSL